MEKQVTIRTRQKLKTTVPEIGNRASIDRKSWNVVVNTSRPIILGYNLYAGLMVMQNHGPGTVEVYGGGPEDDVILCAGDIRIISVRNNVTLVNIGPKPAKLEFDLMLNVK